MWPKRFLTVGLLSAVAAAMLALVLLALLLAGIEWSGVVTLQTRSLAVFAVPGVLVYPICWYALIYRPCRYGTRDTVRLIAWTFAATFLLLIAVIMGWAMIALATHAIFIDSRQWMDAASLLKGMLVIIGLGLLTAACLAIPFAVTAGPVAFAHRAVLLRRFGEP
jgi:hypothetical protein